MALRVVCPFCNAVVEAEGRTACIRCGESFDAASAEPAVGEVVAAVPAGPKTGFLYSRSAVFLSLGLAAAILAVGLAVVRPWEPRMVPQPETKLPVVVSPLGLSGLTYLPARTNVIAAVQPMPLLAYAAQNKVDPRKFLVEAGVPESLLAMLSQAGIPLDGIDHVAVGVAVSSEVGKIIPDVTACLKLTRPIADEAKFLTQLKAEKNSQESKAGRTVYSVQLGLLLMTRIDERTYLFAHDPKDFDLIDKPMPAGGAHLPAALRDAMTTRISPASFFWMATDNEAWTEKPSLKLLLSVNPALTLKDRLPKFAPFRAAAAGLSMEPDPQLRLAVRTADAGTTATVQNFLKGKFTAADVTFSGDAEWAVVQSPFDPKTASLKSILTDTMAAKP